MNAANRTEQATTGNEYGTHRAVLAAEGVPPAWIELIPAGEFHGRDGRGPFRLRDTAAVIAATDALKMAAGLPIDYDHATDLAAPEGRPAPAAGWIRELAARLGALWGRVEWTRHGASALATREYRYISPVFEYAKDGEVVRLLRAALTNNPNLYLTAIAARMGQRPTARGDAERGDRAAGEDNRMETLEGQLREILGLDDDVAPSQILAAVRSLVNDTGDDQASDDATGPDAVGTDAMSALATDGDLARYVPVAQFQQVLTELNTLRAERAFERAEQSVVEATRSGKLVPAQREWAIAYCQADPQGFAAFVARQPAVLARPIAFDGPALKPGDGGLAAHTRGRLTNAELAVCTQLGLRPEEYLRRKTSRDDPFGNR